MLKYALKGTMAVSHYMAAGGCVDKGGSNVRLKHNNEGCDKGGRWQHGLQSQILAGVEEAGEQRGPTSSEVWRGRGAWQREGDGERQ
ncbi:hypothetical protein BHE74_00026483 [Ensete ventricosum]|nr:hypothetical protein GW17_00024606 [Ensete ventricosum]RWW66163.1 hypothetical protein BHE74_00026483 [Ensete ventricosum]